MSDTPDNDFEVKDDDQLANDFAAENKLIDIIQQKSDAIAELFKEFAKTDEGLAHTKDALDSFIYGLNVVKFLVITHGEGSIDEALDYADSQGGVDR